MIPKIIIEQVSKDCWTSEIPIPGGVTLLSRGKTAREAFEGAITMMQDGAFDHWFGCFEEKKEKVS